MGYEKCFGACKSSVAAGKMTFSKISTDEEKGVIKAYLGEGEFTNDPIETVGSPVIAKVANLQLLMKYICSNGFEHHVAMNRSLIAETLFEAFEKYMGWQAYRNR